MSRDIRHYAHTLPGRPESEWQPLRDHLEAVGRLAAQHASAFGADDWGRLAGLWHDLGKYSAAFQEYLRTAAAADPHVADRLPKTDHSSAGAQRAAGRFEIIGHLLAFAIAGHHAGLLDARAAGACLEARLRKAVEPIAAAPASLLEQPPPELPRFVREALGRRDAFSVAFFARMVFSCLVDADFLDTEDFLNPERAAARPRWPSDVLQRMEASLDRYVGTLEQGGGSPPRAIDRDRMAVRDACIAAAEELPGLFSLTVPTGGGKTLSSLAFALRHARKHGLRRVVYVIPFTSIIEQNAGVFRDAMRTLGDAIVDPVIEHHSNLDIEADEAPDAGAGETVRSRLATENWDAPLVVTTSVQFYESLFASRTSRCRKLHSLVRAVIILDEVQTLPVDYLHPCLTVLRELTRNYGSTVVLCTATQPAVGRREGFAIGLDGIRKEIVPDPAGLYERFKRVEVEDLGRVEDTELAARLLEHDRVLCVVNTRGHARALYGAIGDDEAHFHLSALMCPAHRSAVLAKIRRRLEAAEAPPCRVVSTQLVEAGVDIDFPAVYRALAGLDSIAQAAGRCNRNGRLDLGRTFVFRSEHDASERYFAETANCAAQVLPLHDDPLSLDAVAHYFRLYYWDQSARWDARDILDEFHLNQDRALPFLFGFASAAERFRLIEDRGLPVIVPWGEEGAELCAELRAEALPDRRLLRRLQRFTVQVPIRTWREHAGTTVELVQERYAVLSSLEPHYSERTGLTFDPHPFLLT